LQPEEIQKILEAELTDCEVMVKGDNGKYLVSAVGAVFADLNAVKRQQLVYKILNEHIASGAIHAVTMRLMTPAEQQAA